MTTRPLFLLLMIFLAACAVKDETQQAGEARPTDTATFADPMDDAEAPMTPEELEAGRLSGEWTEVVTLDTTGSGQLARNPERWEQISAEQVNRGPIILPLGGDVAGPSVLRVQILLDRAFFSPGMMDGRWGKNTAKAVYFFQQREGLRTTGRVDSATFARLAEVAGAPSELVRAHRLTAADVEGPFVTIPDSIYEHARLECSCYESLGEKLTEQFHLSREVLEKLNPGVELDRLAAGTTIQVPNVPDSTSLARTAIDRLVVSGRGSYVHALDSGGRIVYHFPSTLGATYDPSPQGRFRVTRITPDPYWHYQPRLLARVPDDRPEARIPKGPNNRVGIVWMALSAPHYGIHGTDHPERIGYTSSAGCVRLTNWDARRLSKSIRPGVSVSFRDIRGRTADGGEVGAAPPAAETAPAPRRTASRDTSERRTTAAREREPDTPARPLRRRGSRESQEAAPDSA